MKVSLKEVIGRLKRIESEVNQLLVQLEPLASRLHHAEDASLEAVMGTTRRAEPAREETREGARNP